MLFFHALIFMLFLYSFSHLYEAGLIFFGNLSHFNFLCIIAFFFGRKHGGSLTINDPYGICDIYELNGYTHVMKDHPFSIRYVFIMIYVK